ncbi:MAG: hypothetical protein Q7V01_09015, partial [Vicinamibacterales bacterium]|nr:hypothetical protein [Vicinamibacterales bacterium]
AALLAGVGAGAWPDVDAACAACVTTTGRVSPAAGMRSTYAEAHRIYQALYPALVGAGVGRPRDTS